MKILNPRIHGYIDYLLVAGLALAPLLFKFSRTPSILCWVIAGAVLVMSLLTAYPLGVRHVIPFTVHGGVELLTTPIVIAAPWLFRFSGEEVARNFFVVTGVALGIVYLVTNYRAADTYRDRDTLGGARTA